MLKQRQSVSLLSVVCVPVDEQVPLPLGIRLFLWPIVGPLSGIPVRFCVFPARHADCSPTTQVLESPSDTSANFRATAPGHPPPPDHSDEPGGGVLSVARLLL